jgi:cell division protein FtsI/penicillin-binding protein 2
VNGIEGDRFVARLKNDVKITYALDARLQREMERYLRTMGVDYGALVAIEPSTGRVLALVGYSRRRNDPARPIPLRASFPAASIFKLVTVSAALQETSVTSDTPVRFRGGYHSMDRSVLLDNPRRDRNVLTVEEALAKSCNHCFGKLATRWVGARTLENYTDAFGFNTPFQFEVPLEVSRASIPRDPYELARTGAGFGDTYFSPLHAALMAATIANEGRMIEPYLVDRIEDGAATLYRPQPRILGTPVTPEVAPRSTDDGEDD